VLVTAGKITFKPYGKTKGIYMSLEMSKNIESMLNLAKSDETFREALKKCQSTEEVINLVKGKGINVSHEELVVYKEAISSQELNQEDLDSVTGAFGSPFCLMDDLTPWL
jgi:predicted ribosomally synthesized peptide with nif11-like leader